MLDCDLPAVDKLVLCKWSEMADAVGADFTVLTGSSYPGQ